jgi:serine protease Do
MRIFLVSGILPCLLFTGIVNATSSGNEQLASKVTSRIRAITREKSPAVVRIRCADGHGEVNGTGFYIDPTGTVCTIADIIRGASEITILQDGSALPARVLAIDSQSGLAFLKANETTGASESTGNCFLPARSITIPPALTPVLGIGFPRENGATPALGMITGLENHDGNHFHCVPHLTANLSLTEGEGGSPLLDLSGNLLGMVISGNTQLGICRILPASAIEKLHQDILRSGRLEPGWVGAVVEEAAVPQGNSRARLVSIELGSPAERAGLQPGDIILSLGDRLIAEPEDVLGASFYLTAGQTIRVVILRGGKTRQFDVHCTLPPGSNEDERVGASTPAQLGEPVP